MSNKYFDMNIRKTIVKLGHSAKAITLCVLLLLVTQIELGLDRFLHVSQYLNRILTDSNKLLVNLHLF